MIALTRATGKLRTVSSRSREASAAMNNASVGSRLVAAQKPRRNTRERIYDAALELFATHGYSRTTLRQIAAKVGIEAGSIYSHTASKQQLFFDLVLFCQAEIEQDQEQALCAAPDHPAAQLYAATFSHVGYHCRNPVQAAVLDRSVDILSDEQRDTRSRRMRAYGGAFEAILRQGIKKGEFRAVDVPVTTFGILALGTRVPRWYHSGGRLGPDEVSGIYADQVLRSVAAPKVLKRLSPESLMFHAAMDLFRDPQAAGRS